PIETARRPAIVRLCVQTPLYVTFRKRVTDAIERLVKTQVVPWSFFTSGTPLRIKTFDGREIRFQGVKFDGSPRRIFWARYIEPFLEDLSVSEIAAAVSMARERQVDAPLLLQELRVLLAAGFRTVYRRMVDVDRRLRGGGFPETVEARSVKGELQAMTDFLDEWIQSEIAMCQSASSETRSKPEVGGVVVASAWRSFDKAFRDIPDSFGDLRADWSHQPQIPNHWRLAGL